MGRGILPVCAYILTVQNEGGGLCVGGTVCPEHSRGTRMFGGCRSMSHYSAAEWTAPSSQRPEGKKTSRLRDVKSWTCTQEGGVRLGAGRKADQVWLAASLWALWYNLVLKDRAVAALTQLDTPGSS